MTDSSRPTGVFSPVVTPFGADYSPDTERFVRHCRWLVAQGVGLAVFGTNSEANSMSVDEKKQMLDALLDGGISASRLMPGTGACALPDAIALTRHVVAAGCAGVLMLPPFYYKGVSDDGLFRAFAQVIEGVGDARLRIYLYHIPAVSQVPLSFALIDRLLAAYPGVVAGIKDSSGDLDNVRALIDRFGARGFDVFAGTEAILLETMRAGGAGCITATGNVNPAPIVALYQHWQGTDADARQAALNRTRAAFQQFPMIAAMKEAIAMQSADHAWRTVRPPLTELDQPQRLALTQALDCLGFVMPDAHLLAA
ncbi:dihydrodipicolinate synthase family protein [Cupriavidus sp. TA19]|uniref:dihydrodipicolinate synthase family protein n=1 Tax=unclassified Cupriavidus TaxID=2640874 RepID=UPI000E2F1C97|nr:MULTISPECIES: dihydrodipicolinate synthase family protein [unclassified Cupriavidus]BDB29590.1 dihydrodipicolinate synthase family protein [Cupriavidus sp. P-10]GLC97437.1 dihydrodipicolinate synthase family protein [Cupriavidus sp. TA19]